MGKLDGLARPKVVDLNLPDDDVYPLFDFDDVKTRHVFVTRILRFDDVLDTEMLSASLTKLLQIGDWRKVAGRVVRKVRRALANCLPRIVSRLTLGKQGEKRFEVRVPKVFTKDRPALTVTKEDLTHSSISSHEAAKNLHVPTSEPSIQPVPKGHPIFATGPGFPETVEEMIRRGLPQLSLHMTCFSDATLVALVWTHTLTDAFGVLALLRAWSLILSGRENEVLPVLGSREDVLLAAEEEDQRQGPEPLRIESLRLNGMSLVKWGLRVGWQFAMSHDLKTRTIFIPAHHYKKLLARARQDAATAAAAGTKEDAAEPFISEGDILTAWLSKALAKSEGDTRPITVNGFFNVRAKLLPSANVTSGTHVQNLLVLTYAPLSTEVLDQTVGAIAMKHRQYFGEQTTAKQTLAFTRKLRSEIRTKGEGRYLFGTPDSLPFMVNNFLKADFIKAVDFGPAVIRRGNSAQKDQAAGTMTTYYYHVYGTPLDHLNTFYMLGKDHQSNCWLQANLRPETWAQLDKELKTLG